MSNIFVEPRNRSQDSKSNLAKLLVRNWSYNSDLIILIPKVLTNQFIKNRNELFEKIEEQWSNYHPVLLFLIGFNYCKFKDRYKEDLFLYLAKSIQFLIDRKKIRNSEREKTFENMLEQETLTDVLHLPWLGGKLKKSKENKRNNNSQDHASRYILINFAILLISI